MLAEIGIAVCVGAVVAVWVAGALYNPFRSLHNASHLRVSGSGASLGRQGSRRGRGVCGPGDCRPRPL